MKLYRIAALRLPALLFLRAASFDIQLRNPWNRDHRYLLNVYKHKGYWYHGRNRECATMRRFADLIHSGDMVFEVGGHIGFIAQYLSKLVGRTGSVVVFEPGENNLPYLRRNTREISNIKIEECAVSNENGTANFYLEDLTGQNNSLDNCYKVFPRNARAAFQIATYRKTMVTCVTLDSYCASIGRYPRFVKIDVEGAENLVLQGMRGILLERSPTLMIEVTANNEAVERVLREFGYSMHDENNRPVASLENFSGNLFCIPRRGVQS